MTLRLLQPSRIEDENPRDEIAQARPRDSMASLVSAAIEHNPQAERTLLLAIAPSVLSIVRKVLGVHHPDVDDICQEACVALLTALPSFRGECSLTHFACRVALLTAMAATRRMGHRISSYASVDEEPKSEDDDPPSPASLLDGARRRRALRELLNELPLAQAEVLALHVISGNTVEETSSIVGVPVNTVRSRLRRGLAALRERVDASRELNELLGGRHEPNR